MWIQNMTDLFNKKLFYNQQIYLSLLTILLGGGGGKPKQTQSFYAAQLIQATLLGTAGGYRQMSVPYREDITAR